MQAGDPRARSGDGGRDRQRFLAGVDHPDCRREAQTLTDANPHGQLESPGSGCSNAGTGQGHPSGTGRGRARYGKTPPWPAHRRGAMTPPWSPIRKRSARPSVPSPPVRSTPSLPPQKRSSIGGSSACATTRASLRAWTSRPEIALLEEVWRASREVASDWVAAACRAKGISLNEPVAGRGMDCRSRADAPKHAISSPLPSRDPAARRSGLAGQGPSRPRPRRRRRSRRAVRLLRRRALRRHPRGDLASAGHPPVGDRRPSGFLLQEQGPRGPRVPRARRRQRRLDPADGHPLQDVRRRQRRPPEDEPRQRVPRALLRARVQGAHRQGLPRDRLRRRRGRLVPLLSPRRRGRAHHGLRQDP